MTTDTSSPFENDVCDENAVTYCPEDNKLRIYTPGRVSRPCWLALKAAGYKSTPKQDCSFVATWSVRAEDAAIAMLPEWGEIEDEDYGPQERADDRATRFERYRDNRRADAHAEADRYDDGPGVFGHQNRGRAERLAARHDRIRLRALSNWSKAEYWQHRTQGVIDHALYKSTAPVRRDRIKRLETEQRKLMKDVEEARERWNAWKRIAAAAESDPATATATAIKLAGSRHHNAEYEHPRITGLERSPYSLLKHADDPITGAEAAALYLDGMHDDGPGYEGSRADRWLKLYEFRLIYERMMLESQGGAAFDVEIVPGGRILGKLIERVNNSSATGKPVSVLFVGGRRPVNIERIGADAYTAPTEADRNELAEHLATKKAAAAKVRAERPAPKLINPTPEDAERLQAIWNERAISRGTRPGYDPPPVVAVRYMTQAEYSSASGSSSYGSCQTIEVGELGHRIARHHTANPADGRFTVFKVRKSYSRTGFTYAADAVVCITDKPQKPIPWDEMERVRGTIPTEAQTAARLPELQEVMKKFSADDHWPPEMRQLLEDARYHGLAYRSTVFDRHLTEKGVKALEAQRSAEPVTV